MSGLALESCAAWLILGLTLAVIATVLIIGTGPLVGKDSQSRSPSYRLTIYTAVVGALIAAAIGDSLGCA